jgi:hypothetical protein
MTWLSYNCCSRSSLCYILKNSSKLSGRNTNHWQLRHCPTTPHMPSILSTIHHRFPRPLREVHKLKRHVLWNQSGILNKELTSSRVDTRVASKTAIRSDSKIQASVLLLWKGNISTKRFGTCTHPDTTALQNCTKSEPGTIHDALPIWVKPVVK